MLSYLDWVVLVIMLLMVAAGLLRGMGRSFIALAIWLIAFGGACLATNPLVGYIKNYIDDPPFAYLLTFLTIFAVLFIILGLINLIVGLFVPTGKKPWASRVMGALLGIIRACFVGFMIVFIITGVPGSKAHWISQSWSYHLMHPWAHQLQKQINFPQGSSKKQSSSRQTSMNQQSYPF